MCPGFTNLLEMIRFHANVWFTLSKTLEIVRHSASIIPEEQNPEHEARMVNDVVLVALKGAGLPGAVSQAKRIVGALANPIQLESFGGYSAMMHHLQVIIEEDLERIVFFQVSPDRAKYITDKSLLGAEVTNKFPSTILDAEGCGRCIATDRRTQRLTGQQSRDTMTITMTRFAKPSPCSNRMFGTAGWHLRANETEKKRTHRRVNWRVCNSFGRHHRSKKPHGFVREITLPHAARRGCQA